MERQGLIREVAKADTMPLLATPKAFDAEMIVSLEMIRHHTKTEDVPTVTDDQLRLYRASALQMAEKYSGYMLSAQRQITEPLELPSAKRFMYAKNPWFTHETGYPVADGIVYTYGIPGGRDQAIMVPKGARRIRVPFTHMDFGVNSCCNPCASPANGPSIMYLAGLSCEDDVPPCVIEGVLKYIAWAVSNPGDEIMTVRNRKAGESTGIIGTNNGGWASGAIELWRACNDEAI